MVYSIIYTKLSHLHVHILSYTLTINTVYTSLDCLLKQVRFRLIRVIKIFGIWPHKRKQASKHTHASNNAVFLVWGSLRLAPTKQSIWLRFSPIPRLEVLFPGLGMRQGIRLHTRFDVVGLQVKADFFLVPGLSENGSDSWNPNNLFSQVNTSRTMVESSWVEPR